MSFTFTLRLGAVIAGTLVLGCNLSSSPVVVRIDGIRIAPDRLSLLPYQAAGVTIDLIRMGSVVGPGCVEDSLEGSQLRRLGRSCQTQPQRVRQAL